MATLKDIGEIVGVKPSTVSVVLNHKDTRIKVSEATRQKVFAAAEKLNYRANSSARALVTGRSGNLGFILSDQITGGWGNAYFAGQLMGAEDRCRELGYGLSISRYNLDNVEDFVFPQKVTSRNVDGLVLAGETHLEVVKKFLGFDTPCVCVGMNGINPEVANLVPSVGVNEIATATEALAHGHRLGHRHFGMCISPTKRWRQAANEAKRRILSREDTADSVIEIFESSRQADWFDGEKAFETWQALDKNRRPTLMFGSDQAMIGFLKAMKGAGLNCPDDISLIANVDTNFCNYTDPPLTAMSANQASFGEIAVDLLVNHLDKGATIGPEQSILEPKFKLIERESCRRVSAGSFFNPLGNQQE